MLSSESSGDEVMHSYIFDEQWEKRLIYEPD